MSTPQNVLVPGITTSYGTPMPAKKRAVFLQSGMTATINLQMLDSNGVPSDLTLYGIGSIGPTTAGVIGRMRESVGSTGVPMYQLGNATIINAPLGQISFSLPQGAAANPAVYDFEAAVQLADGTYAFSNTLWIWVERGLFETGITPTAGMPTVAEIRTNLRDSDPAGNILIDDTEFDLAELCVSAAWVVRYFNESQPPLQQKFDTRTFPWKVAWLDGICGYLYMLAAAYYRRNVLKYQAGGIAVDDLEREQPYLAIGQAKTEEFKKWVLLKKAQINAEAAFTSLGSDYGFFGGYGGGW